MKERGFQNIFSAWVRDNPPKESMAWELKMEKGTSLPFNRVDDHQIAALQEVKRKGKYYKIPDAPFGHSTGFRFHAKKPFDCLFITSVHAYVAVLFYKLRAKKEVYFIDIDIWMLEKHTSKRKSLTEYRAREIASSVIIL